MKTLSYKDTSTWKYHLDELQLEWVTDYFNRSVYQSQFLFNLVEGDYAKLVELELKIKHNFVSWCPDTVENVNELLNLNNIEKINIFQILSN